MLTQHELMRRLMFLALGLSFWNWQLEGKLIMVVNTHPLLNGAWRHIQEGNPEVDALDEEVRETSYLEKMCCVVTLGIICTGTQPSTRPSMKEVLQVLLRCN